MDKFDRVWYAEWFGLGPYHENFSGIIDTKNDSIITFESLTNGLFSSKEVLHISQTKDQTRDILIATRKGIVYKYNGSSFKEIFKVKKPTVSKPLFVEPTDDGSLWIMLAGEVLKIKNKTILERHQFPKENYFAFQIIPHPSELIVELGIKHKISQYWRSENGVFAPYIEPKDTVPNQPIIRSEFRDIYYSNTDKDLLIKDVSGKTLFYYKNNLGRESFKDNRGIYWFATQNGAIKISVKESPFTILQAEKSIRGIYKDENLLCIGTNNGNFFKNLNSGEIYNPFERWQRTAYSFSKDKDGHIWVGSIGHEILEFQPQEKKCRLIWMTCAPFVRVNSFCTYKISICKKANFTDRTSSR